jgi:hypothetical protein
VRVLITNSTVIIAKHIGEMSVMYNCAINGQHPDTQWCGEIENNIETTLAADDTKHRFTNSHPEKAPNRDLRTREHLTEGEVERLMQAAKDNRYGYRDTIMILAAYRLGLRVCSNSEEIACLRTAM